MSVSEVRSSLLFAPSRVRGLKHHKLPRLHQRQVRTFTGAWIETLTVAQFAIKSTFAPSRVRGLKQRLLELQH